MTSNHDQEKFIVTGNRLTVRTQLALADEKPYSEALFKLLNTEHKELEIDFSGLDYVSSSYVGATALLVMVAEQRKQLVKVLAHSEVARIFHMAGLDELIEVQIIPD